MASAVGRGSSRFEDVPVLGAVKIVRPVGRCILTAPVLRQGWPAVKEPRDANNQTVTAGAVLTISSVLQMTRRISKL